MRLLAYDVGGSAIKHAISDENGNLTDKGSVPNSWDNHADFVEAIGQVFDAAHAQEPVDGVAISSAGELDPYTGSMYSGGALQYNKGTNMIEDVGARVGVPVSLENDGNSALMAEMADGALADATNGMVLVLGTGVGGGVMINRAVYYGSHFHSGNASFLRADLDDPDSSILGFTGGSLGLLKEHASLAGLPEAVSGHDFFALVDAGDPTAVAVLEAYAHRLGSAILNLQAILDMDVVAIGGGISAQASLIDAIRRHTDVVFSKTFVPIPAPQVRACRYRNDANLIGAVRHFLATR
ncbi:ROK family protein [Propioniciclava sp.]|uniref:ROK family protein n=1 Tax=Propioniciclava sp. TaxID=2038686 RepID=UPI00261B88CD|nr:ROK family protein [Propioniciclava sp.]